MDLTGSNYFPPCATEEGSSAVTKSEVKGARRVRNACLQCRERKIRCSRTYPCKGCVSRGDRDACDWQGGFPSGDIPVHQQRVVQQRQEFDELNTRITRLKVLMSNHLRQPYKVKNRYMEWTQTHPELEDRLHDILYSDSFSSNQQNKACQPGPKMPEWALPWPCPPDSTASFETCPSSATEKSTFRSLGRACSTSSHSSPTVGSFLFQAEASSPVPFLTPCRTSFYKSWKDLREASPDCLNVKTNALLDVARLQQHQNASFQGFPTLDQLPCFPHHRSPPFLNQENYQLVTGPSGLGEPPPTGEFQTPKNLYPNPNMFNPFSVVNQEQGLRTPNSVLLDESLYNGRTMDQISHRFPVEMALPELRCASNASNPRRATWAGNGQPTPPLSLGSSITMDMLSFEDVCRIGAKDYQLDLTRAPQYLPGPLVEWK